MEDGNRDAKSLNCPSCGAGADSLTGAYATLEATGVGDDWIIFAELCTKCGCVYIGQGPNRRIKGYLINGHWALAIVTPD